MLEYQENFVRSFFARVHRCMFLVYGIKANDPFMKDIIMKMVSVSCLESNYGTSGICLKRNNYFGMKNPKYRVTFSIPSTDKFAMYYEPESSILDYILWLKYVDYDFSDLFSFMQSKGYCHEEVKGTYESRLNDIYKSLKTLKLW